MTLEQFRALHSLTSEFDIIRHSLWVAPLQNQRNRMVGFFRDNTEKVYSSELYMNKDDLGETYARINFQWQESSTAVNTALIGPKEVISRYAKHDHKLLLPISTGGIQTIYGEPLLSSNELPSLDLLKSINIDTSWYYVRPSSFVCTSVSLRNIENTKVKVILLQHVIGGRRSSEFFVHIHEAHEDNSPWLEEKNGFILSNSITYVTNHPEIQFVEFDSFQSRLEVISEVETLKSEIDTLNLSE